MTTQLVRPPALPAADLPPPRKAMWPTVLWALLGCAVVAFVIVVAHNARYGAVAERIKNPAVHGAPRPVTPLFGWTHWITFLQLWHWPETWPLVSLSPTVEPFIVIGYVMFYLAPFFGGIWVLRRLQRRRPVDSFVWRHPLVSLAILIFMVGFVYDAVQEILLIRAQLYIYSQVIPFGSVFAGKPYQFPLLWESALVTAVMIPAGVLLYRDDSGRTVAEKLSQRVRAFRGREALGTFVVMFLVLNAAYLFVYGGSFAVIRASGAATSVACPWPFPEAKVYDPQGFYEQAGQPGPFSAGIWSGWATGQSGRPAVSPPVDGGRCSP